MWCGLHGAAQQVRGAHQRVHLGHVVAHHIRDGDLPEDVVAIRQRSLKSWCWRRGWWCGMGPAEEVRDRQGPLPCAWSQQQAAMSNEGFAATYAAIVKQHEHSAAVAAVAAVAGG